MAKWDHDDWVTVQPDEKKIVCKDCYFRELDRKYFLLQSHLKSCLTMNPALTIWMRTKMRRKVNAGSYRWGYCRVCV